MESVPVRETVPVPAPVPVLEPLPEPVPVPESLPVPGGRRVDLWLVRCPEPDAPPDARALAGPDVLDVLDAAERKRAAALRRPADRALYVASHLALRTLLGAYLRLPAREVLLVREPCPGCGGPHGRPAVPGTPPPLHFSLSHSHGLALIAVAAVPVGVDVQRVPGPGTVDACAPSLHPAERAELDRLPPGARPGAFAQLWARKEAYLKGIGTGLARPASADYLGAATRSRPHGWTVADVSAPPGHTAALAVLGTAPPVTAVRRLPARLPPPHLTD
ncbi:4'-phosphopantetheinyl transferase family protein [Streptomyces sp. SCL15-4]|uniref:4'-phosphopantetheinyl transferase family protein n=1 Tax=Streptomyces sp. SCL15-4 TaxID=2967221 RepID=UPI002965F4B6|nr:4'-phosphopantetheinyl transferase superfamily protein [Streptomyces sp. SCL15-4]